MKGSMVGGAAYEREQWDQRATLHEVWSEPTDRWSECLSHVLPEFGALPLGANILDLGCGIGRLSNRLARLRPQYNVIGIDISPNMIAAATLDARPLTNVTYHLCDGRALPDLPDIHAAYSIVTFQHLESRTVRGYIYQMARVLVPGACFRFQFVEGITHGSLTHDHDTREILHYCTEAGLEVVRIAGGLMYPQWRWVTARKP